MAELSEQVEAKMVDRQQEFQAALIGGQPLRPRNGEWTLGDMVALAGQLSFMMKSLREFSEEEFQTPVSEIWGGE